MRARRSSVRRTADPARGAHAAREPPRPPLAPAPRPRSRRRSRPGWAPVARRLRLRESGRRSVRARRRSLGTVTRQVESLLVPGAQRLQPSSVYLSHLDAGPSLVRLASNESAEPPSPRVAAALAETYAHAHRYPSTTPPLRRELA